MRDIQTGGRSLVGPAAIFYGALIAGALAWGWLAGWPWLVFDPAVVTPARLVIGAALGLALGLLFVTISRLSADRFDWARELLDWFSAVLGPLTCGQAALLALLSGIGEELFFRGAMQPSLGLWPTTIVFALLHLPPRLRFWSWTASAALLGLAFGLLALWSGNLAGPVLAHVTVNFLNLREIGRRAASSADPGPRGGSGSQGGTAARPEPDLPPSSPPDEPPAPGPAPSTNGGLDRRQNLGPGNGLEHRGEQRLERGPEHGLDHGLDRGPDFRPRHRGDPGPHRGAAPGNEPVAAMERSQAGSENLPPCPATPSMGANEAASGPELEPCPASSAPNAPPGAGGSAGGAAAIGDSTARAGRDVAGGAARDGGGEHGSGGGSDSGSR